MGALKPCPFCGGESHYRRSENAGWHSRGKDLRFVEIGCVRCGANVEVMGHCDQGETSHALEEQAAQLWNARAIDRDELLRVADECERADVDGVIDWAARIRKAVGE